MAISVQMPALGESVTEGTVTRWLKQEGDTVEQDEPLLEVSTDKVDTEIPSPVAGVLLATDGLQPSSKGARVKLSEGKVTVTDGPFIETKELVASYALFQVNSMAEAIEWTTRFLKVLGEGECELRPIFEASDFPAEIFSPEEAARDDATRVEMQKNAAKQ